MPISKSIPEKTTVSTVSFLPSGSPSPPTSPGHMSRASSMAIAPASPVPGVVACKHVDVADMDVEDGNDKAEKNNLRPVDGGVAAWMFLAGSFVIEATMWGFTLTFGVFQSFYEEDEQFIGNKNIAVIGTVMTGLPYIGAPIATSISSRYHSYQRAMIVGGWLCCIIGLVGASFAQTVPILILTQGVVYGLGVLTYYYASLSMLNEWFDKRRGLAYGILFGANGLSGVALPYIIEKLLSRYGYATTLRCYAIGAVLITLPALFCLRGRLPHAPAPPLQPLSLLAVLQIPKFWSFAISNLLQGVASYIPSIFLPTFASSLSLPRYSGPLLLAIFNLFQAFSDLCLGYLSDKLSVSILLFFSSSTAGIFVLLLWGLAPLSSHSLPILIVFAALYGAAAGGYSALYPRMATALTPEERAKKMLYGVWCLERGVGNVLAGPLSGVLVSGRAGGGLFGAGRFEGLVAFTGACLVLSAVAVLGNAVSEWRKKENQGQDSMRGNE